MSDFGTIEAAADDAAYQILFPAIGVRDHLEVIANDSGLDTLIALFQGAREHGIAHHVPGNPDSGGRMFTVRRDPDLKDKLHGMDGD